MMSCFESKHRAPRSALCNNNSLIQAPEIAGWSLLSAGWPLLSINWVTRRLNRLLVRPPCRYESF